VKKMLFILGLAVLFAVVMAAPALAYQPTMEPSPGNAYVLPSALWYGADDWWEVDAAGNFIDHLGGTDAIPADYDVWIVFGWITPIRGQAVTIPSSYLTAITVKDAQNHKVLQVSTSEAKGLWTVVYNPGAMPAFNKAEAPGWQRDWYVKLPELAAGTYTGTNVQIYTRIITDSSFDGTEWAKHAQQRPLKNFPETVTDSFSFTIAQGE
jgi:hypothetical protein